LSLAGLDAQKVWDFGFWIIVPTDKVYSNIPKSEGKNPLRFLRFG
jgi:hypothetical protein